MNKKKKGRRNEKEKVLVFFIYNLAFDLQPRKNKLLTRSKRTKLYSSIINFNVIQILLFCIIIIENPLVQLLIQLYVRIVPLSENH